MATIPIDINEFCVPFIHTGDAFDYASQLEAVRAALGLDPGLKPYYREAGMTNLGTFTPNAGYDGKLRINAIQSVTKKGTKVHTIQCSFVLYEDGALKAWSRDLDDTSPYKPLGVWFRNPDSSELEMTDALRAAIKALVPKKPRAKKTP
jgi:hypothetical protein